MNKLSDGTIARIDRPRRPRWSYDRFLTGLFCKSPSERSRTPVQPMPASPYEFLGSGFEYDAYLRREDDKVVKINRESAHLGPQALDALKNRVRAQHELLVKYLGSTVAASHVSITEHILGENCEIVQILQAYVDTQANPLPFTARSPYVNIDDIYAITSRIPGVDVALGEFCHAARRVFKEEGVLPDTNGEHNIVVPNDGSVVLIDTIPIGPEHPAVQDMISNQLDSLELALQEIS